MGYDPLTEHLINEGRDVGQDIRRLVGDQVRFLSLGLTVVGAVAAFVARAAATGPSDDETLIARMFLPLALGGVVSYALLLGAEIMALGGYKRRIEEVVNVRVGAPLMQWESVIAPRVTIRPLARLLFYVAVAATLLAFAWDGLSILSLSGGGSHMLHVASWAALASYVYGTVVLVAAHRHLLSAGPAAYALASLGTFPAVPAELTAPTRRRWWR